MATLFSEDVLQRSTFLDERRLQSRFADYDSIINQVKRTLPEQGRVRFLFNELVDRLCCSSQYVHEGGRPQWVAFFQELTARPGGVQLHASTRFREQHAQQEAYSLPFFTAVCRFINDASQWLQSSVNADSKDAVCYCLAEWYAERMIETARFVLHLDFVQSGLDYWSWCRGFDATAPQNSRWYSIACEFPVLIRWLWQINQNCRARVREMFDRLDQDRSEIALKFGLDNDEKMTAIKLGLSDPHRGGSSVARLEFESGVSIIYKPKPLELDAALYDFVSATQVNFGVVPLKTLPKQGYGWVEDAGSLVRKGQSLDYPEAIGNAGMLFWLLNATDLHSENVVSTEAGVFALDLETLLLPYAAGANASELHSPWRSHSIYKTMLFDVSFGAHRQNVSGFVPSPDLKYMGPEVIFQLEDDRIMMQQRQPPRKDPVVEGPAADVRSINYSTTVAGRVADAFRAAHCDSVIFEVQDFVRRRDDSTIARVVLRDTYFYSRLLDRMRQPRHLRDGAVMCCDLFSLHIAVQGAEKKRDHIHSLIEDEIRQLLRGDIPYFACEIGKRDLITSGGRLGDFFTTSGKDHSLEKLRCIESSDREEQVALMQIAMGHYRRANLPASPLNGEGDRGATGSAANCGTQRDCFENDLGRLAGSIMSAAFRPQKSPARWISMFGDVSGNESGVDIGDPGYFSGSWGILLAIQAAQTALGDAAEAAGELDRFLQEQADHWCRHAGDAAAVKQDSAPLLGYSGIGGEVFAKSVLISLNNKRWEFLLPQIASDVVEARRWIQQDKLLDVIGGAAGLILGCEQFLQLNISAAARDEAKTTLQACAEHLATSARSFGGGLAWFIPQEDHPLLGYAHGWAGVTAALNCARVRASERFQKDAIETCLRGAALFPAELLACRGNWLDYRANASGWGPLNRSWCNGQPGVLRGLLETQANWSQNVARKSTEVYEETVESFDSSDIHRFCCGEMGNADLFLDLTHNAIFETDITLKARVIAMIKKTISAYANGQLKPTSEKVFPGLFHGAGGVVYTAARLLRPQLPSLSGQCIPNP